MNFTQTARDHYQDNEFAGFKLDITPPAIEFTHNKPECKGDLTRVGSNAGLAWHCHKCGKRQYDESKTSGS